MHASVWGFFIGFYEAGIAMDEHALLRQQQPFCSLNKDALDRVVLAFHSYRFARQEKLVIQDEVTTWVGFVISGVIDLRIKRYTGGDLSFCLLERGDFFGLMSFEPKGISIASAVGAAPGVVLMVRRSAFQQMLETYPVLKAYFYKMSLDRVWTAYQSLYQGKATECPSPVMPGWISLEVQKSIDFIDQNFMNPITLEETARANGMSKFHFSRIFKDKTGMSFKEYLNMRRIHVAKKLFVTDNLNVSEACYQVGFNDQSYFCRVFRKLEGYTPSEFKKVCTGQLSSRKRGEAAAKLVAG